MRFHHEYTALGTVRPGLKKVQPDEFAVFNRAALIHVPATNLYG
jgi:hypothetical protein